MIVRIFATLLLLFRQQVAEAQAVEHILPIGNPIVQDGSPLVGNIHAANKIKGMIGAAELGDVDAKQIERTMAISILDSIREYQSDPDNDFTRWKTLMNGFSPDSTTTFELTEDSEVYMLHIHRSRPIFRAAWVLSEGSESRGLTVKVFDPKGEMVYWAKDLEEGIVALEAVEFGEYVIEITSPRRGDVSVTLMLATSGAKDLGELYDLKSTQDGALKLVRSASDLKRSTRFFQRRRSSHQKKIERNLVGVRNASIAVMFCAILVALLQVASIKHLVRQRLKTMLF